MHRVARTLKIARAICYSVIAVALLAFVAGSFVNATVVEGVSVTFIADADEPRDVALDAAERRPDYRLDLVDSDGGRRSLGVFPNVSARGGLRFEIAEVVPRRGLQELILIEDDPVSNDVLARVQGGADFPATTNGFRFSLHEARTIDGGMRWFFDTPVGRAILWGVGVAVLILVLSLIARHLPPG